MTPTAIHSSVVTRPTQRTAISSTIDQSTAKKSVIYEHACLFTHDIRRKNTKRWQDGYLRFHQFNCRIMVYDQSRNYVGDTHYQSTGTTGLEDGDEIQLDRGGVLVQVAERLSTQETDLTDLLAKRAPKQPSQEANTNFSQHPSRTPNKTSTTAARAELPKRSPFDVRQDNWRHRNRNDDPSSDRPAKRARIDNEHVPLQQLLRTSKSSGNPFTLSNEPAITTSNHRRINKEILSEDTPQHRLRPANTAQNLQHLPFQSKHRGNNSDGQPQTEATQTSKINKNDLHHVSADRKLSKPSRLSQCRSTLPEAPQPTASPPVSTTSHVFIEINENQASKSSVDEQGNIPDRSDDPKKKKRPLRLATSAPKRKLLCQTLGKPLTTNSKTIESSSPKAPPEPLPSLPSVNITAAIQAPPPHPEDPYDTSIFDYEDLPPSPPLQVQAEEQGQEQVQNPKIPPGPQNQTKPSARPLRRHFSDTSPQKQPTTHTLKRAETIGAPQEKKTTYRQPLHPRTDNPKPRTKATEAQKAIEADTDIGPWSREAWDLFGWCPGSKSESLGWTYLTS